MQHVNCKLTSFGQDHFYGCRESVLLTLVTGWTGGLLVFLAQFPLLHLSQHRHKTSLNLTVFNVLNYMFSIAGVFFTINRLSIFIIDIIFCINNNYWQTVSGRPGTSWTFTTCRLMKFSAGSQHFFSDFSF